jgi:F0F1-type ATP synthase assembly protein I
MVKTGKPTTTAADSIESGKTSKKEVTPGNQFIGASLDMLWKLAIVVLIPIVGGYKIDSHFNSVPLWTVVGFVIAMIGTTIIIKKTMDEFNTKVYSKGNK